MSDVRPEVKLFEIRDRATFIPTIAVRLVSREAQEAYLLRRAGWSAQQVDDREEANLAGVLLTRIDGGPCEYDVYNWTNRTWRVAHQYIIDHWASLESGQVIDVEFILEETSKVKVSERFTTHWGG